MMGLRIFEFSCKHCGEKSEEYLSDHEIREMPCGNCGETKSRVVTPAFFDCGNGIDPDFPTAYEKWGNRRKLGSKYMPKKRDEQ
jgi:hypothetical protein